MVYSVSEYPLALGDPRRIDVAQVGSLSSTYRADIDGLRAIAALSVIAVHTDLVSGGFVGVDVFFVISGYLISGIILRAIRAGRFSLVEFYARRAKRILPALIAMLLTSCALAWLILSGNEYRLFGRDVLEGAAFILNLAPWFHADSDLTKSPLGHLWSLGVEEQFYFLWPVLLLWGARSRGRQLTMMLAVIAVSFAINIHIAPQGHLEAYLPPWTRLWELAFGGVLVHSQMAESWRPAWLRSLACAPRLAWLARYRQHMQSILGALLIGVSCAALDDPMTFPGWRALAPTVGCVLLIAAGPQGVINRYVLSSSPLVLIGLISYPLYLWHAVLLEFRLVLWPASPPITAAVIALAFVLSVLTYRYVEAPFRSSNRLLPTAAGLYAALLACALVGGAIYAGDISSHTTHTAHRGEYFDAVLHRRP